MTSWLRAQKKSDLIDIADSIGLNNISSLKKSELESALDEFLTENASHLSSDLKLAPFYNIRSKTSGSPVKREAPAPGDIKVPKRRSVKAAPADESGGALGALGALAADEEPATADSIGSSSSSSALIRTPARALSLAASRIALPATPTDIAVAVDRSAVAVRTRALSIYADSGITEATQATRESLSTVYSIALLVSAFEWFHLRAEVLPVRYAFTIPAIQLLGTGAYPVSLPDVFLLLTWSFWAPVLLWFAVSTAVPSLVGYFFNLSAASASHHTGRGRSRPFSSAEYAVDPLTFSLAKALLIFVVLAQGATLGGWIDGRVVARLNAGLYGGWQGAITGAAVTGLVSLYDAVLRK